jgi:excisionase family DNA binding protein
MKTKIYKPLNVTARMLGLPTTYIKELAEKNKIPMLIVRERMRFNPEAVRQALDELATKGDCSDAK